MFDSILNWFKGAFAWVGRLFTGIWDAIKGFFNWTSALIIGLVGIFTDVLHWLWDMVSQVFGAISTLISGMPTGGSMSGGAQGLVSGADYFLPLSESWTMLQSYCILFSAAIVLKLVRMIKKFFWAA